MSPLMPGHSIADSELPILMRGYELAELRIRKHMDAGYQSL